MTGQTVWLASYPKSGNTWFRAVYTALGSDVLDINDLLGRPIAAAREAIDAALGLPSSLLTDDEVHALRPRVDEVLDAAATGVLLRKVHDALLPGPSGQLVVSPAATRSAVYVVRDPRDVALSLASHNETSVEDAVAQLCDARAAIAAGSTRLRTQARQALGTWSEHVTSWLDGAPFPVHLVRYEDCQTRPIPTFAAALAAVGMGRSEHDVTLAVEAASFARLQAAEAEHGFRERRAETAVFFRRGASGGWVDELPAPLARRIEEAHADVMARLGYRPGPP